MTKNVALARPAMSAIAAFLVLSAPAAFAQETPTIMMTPPIAAPTPPNPSTVAEPSAAAPVAAPQTAQPAAPKPVIRVPLDIAPETTAPAPKSVERAAAPARAERTARPAVARAAAPVADAPALAEAAPIATPVTTPVEPIVEAAPLPAEKANMTGSDFPWAIAGGAAALLFVGGAGLAFARRRRIAREGREEAPAYERVPVATAKRVTDEAQPGISPAYAPREEAVIAPRSVPTFAATPSGGIGRHQAMAMAGPTAANPFATLNKRLKRAGFLDQQERVAYDEMLGAQKDMTRKPVGAWEIARRPAPAIQKQDVRRAEPARVRTTTKFRPGYSSN